jgi:hypothetical protein
VIADEEKKRELVLRFLPIGEPEHLRNVSIEAFNRFFGAGWRPSPDYIQSPGTWSMGRFDETIASNEDFLATCRFKWAFNAKPDIVIQTGQSSCVCIEAKLESDEGRYPTSAKEKAIFKRRGLSRVLQTELQRYMLTELLGMEAEFLFLALKRPSEKSEHRLVTWSEAFAAMDLDLIPAYMQSTISAMTSER